MQIKELHLPDEFVKRTQLILGNEYATFEAALTGAAPVSIRVNNKTGLTPDEEKVSWCDTGYYLKERPLFTADPLLHGGAYYVQEASSMFLSRIVDKYLHEAVNVLDLCAAPGGKSTLLSQYLPENCLLVSNEIVRQRAHILAENLTKWGNPNVIVTNNEPAHLGRLSGFFDAIVIDAPCSGEGMFRKDPNAISEWSVENVQTCVTRQQAIVEDVWDALKKDGILIYSTCTYNREENEENVRWICENLDATILKIADVDENITETDEGYRFYPHKTKGEGFFIAVLQKKSDTPNPTKLKVKEDKKLREMRMPGEIALQLQPSENYRIFESETSIVAFPTQHLHSFLYFRQQFNCLVAGIEMYGRKGKDLIPETQLSLSKALSREKFNTVEVDYTTAIQFLKKETIDLKESPRGYLLICYKNLPLGWVKNIGNRCNNLYPQHWRIRMNL